MEERILLIQLRQLGDILLTTPCIRAVKRARPKARVTVLTHGMGRLVLDQSPDVDEHFFYEDSWTWRQHLRLAKALRDRRFDLVIDFMNNPRSALLTWATRAEERLACRSARRWAYTRVIPRPVPGRYIVREKFDLLAAAGISGGDEGLVLPWFEPHTQPFMRLYAQDSRVREAPVRVALSPTHRRERRRWPLAAYARLSDRLSREWGAACLFVWGPGEEDVVDACLALCKEPAIKAPKTTFRELAAFIANLDLFVGNSNGPSHVAVAQDVPSLQLHGHTSGVAWCPDTARHRFVESPDRATMEPITPEKVWDKLESMRHDIEVYARRARERGPRLNWYTGALRDGL